MSTDNIAVYITNNTTSSGSNPGDANMIFGNSWGLVADNIGGEFVQKEQVLGACRCQRIC